MVAAFRAVLSRGHWCTGDAAACLIVSRPMNRAPSTPPPDLRRRLRRWSREIALALAVTLAAVVYLVGTGPRDRANPAGATQPTPGQGTAVKG